MKVLIVGTTPPPGGGPARELARAANELRAAGHQVELLSPDPRSAAHRHARLDGPLLALWLAWLAPRFDAVILRLEPGLPLGPHAGRLTRAVTLSALGFALRGYEETTIRFDGGPPIPNGLGGRAMGAVWAETTRIVVASEDKRTELIASSGLDPDQVEVSKATPAQTRPWREGWTVVDDDDLRAGVLESVRARATSARAAERIRDAIGEPVESFTTSPLSGERAAYSATLLVKEASAAARKVVERVLSKSD